MTKQKPGTADTVQSPAQNCGKGETAKRPGKQHRYPVPPHRCESLGGQLSSHIAAVRNGYTAAKDHQRCQRADQNGIQKHFQNPHHPLLRRMVNLRGTVGNGSCTHPRFVGKYTPGTAHTKRLKGRTQDSSGGSPGRERSLKNEAKGTGYPVQPQQQNTDTEQDIPRRYRRNQSLCRLSDPLCATEQHSSHQQRKEDAHDQVSGWCFTAAKAAQDSIDTGDHGVDLGCVAHSKCGENAEKAVNAPHPPPFFAHSMADHVHGTAQVFASFPHPVANRQGSFRIFGRHSQKAAQPHPEDGSGTTDTNGPCHTYQITCTGCGSQGCAKCLKGRNTRFSSAARTESAYKRPDRRGKEAKLRKACADA